MGGCGKGKLCSRNENNCLCLSSLIQFNCLFLLAISIIIIVILLIILLVITITSTTQSALHDANTAHVALDGWLAERASAAATAEEEEKEEAEKARSNGSGNGNSSSSNGGASSNSYSSASYSHSGSHSTNNEELKVHSALAPADPCSAKMLSLVSEAAALDDTLYALDRGLQAQAIPLELFLKQVSVGVCEGSMPARGLSECPMCA